MLNLFFEGDAAAIFPEAGNQKTARRRVFAGASTAILGLAAMLASGLWASAIPVARDQRAEETEAPATSSSPQIVPVEQLVAGLEGEDVASDAFASLAQFFATAPESDQEVTGPLGFSEWSQPEGMGVSDPSQEVRDVEVFLDTDQFSVAAKVFEFTVTATAEISFDPPAAGQVGEPAAQPEHEPGPQPLPEPDGNFQIEYHDGDAVNLFTFNEDTRQGWTTAQDGAAIALPPVLAGFLYAAWEEAGADDEYLVVNAADLFSDALFSDNTILEAPIGFEM